MIKKLMSLLLALILLTSVGGSLAEEQASTAALPSVGDVVEGFEVKEIRPFSMIGANLVLFEHQKTGGKMLWMANDDINRTFQLSFPTLSSSVRGLYV